MVSKWNCGSPQTAVNKFKIPYRLFSIKRYNSGYLFVDSSFWKSFIWYFFMLYIFLISFCLLTSPFFSYALGQERTKSRKCRLTHKTSLINWLGHFGWVEAARYPQTQFFHFMCWKFSRPYTVNDYRQNRCFFFYPHLHINIVAPPCFSASQDKAFANKNHRQCG